MAELIQRFCPSYAVMKNEEKAEELRKLLPNHSCEILYGMDGFVAVSTLPNVDVVVAAMVGMIGLRPVMEAIRAGKDIALANKETLVTAGHIIMPLAKEYGVSILPVDSEHSAIFQCLNGEKSHRLKLFSDSVRRAVPPRYERGTGKSNGRTGTYASELEHGGKNYN